MIKKQTNVRRVFIALLLLGLFLSISFAFLKPSTYLALDSFTYFTLAKKVSDAGLLYSFTGLDHTTGFHPLYYFLLIPFYPLFGISLPEWSFYINGLLILGALYLLYRRGGLVLFATSTLLLTTQRGMSMTNNGVESALAFVGFALVYHFLTNDDGKGKSISGWDVRSAFFLGGALSMAFAARLDSVFLVLATAATLLYQFAKGRQLKDFLPKATYTGLPLLLTAIVIMSLNYTYGGHLTPVSGAFKSTFPSISPRWLVTAMQLKTFIISLIASAGALIMLNKQKAEKNNIIPLAAFSGATLLLYLYNNLFVLDGIGAWYGVLPFFTLCLSVGLGVDLLLKKKKMQLLSAAPVIVCLLLWSGIIYGHAKTVDTGLMEDHRAAAVAADALIAEGGATASLKDGMYAFYTAHPVYNLTGLANNEVYIDAVRGGEVRDYLASKAVTHIVAGNITSGVQIPEHKYIFDCTDPVYESTHSAIFTVDSCLSE